VSPSRQTAVVTRAFRAALAGVAGAGLWALQEPYDQRLFGCDYSDLAVLGKAFTRGPYWRRLGLALHLLNGALFGIVIERVSARCQRSPARVALLLSLAEHLGLYPLCALVDRRHPARGQAGVPPLLRNRRAFAQASWRHLLFGLVVGRLSRAGSARRPVQARVRRGRRAEEG